MNKSKVILPILTLGLTMGLSACGGGGGGGGSSTAAASTTVGAVSGFGSVYVNGCEYETESASFYVDGQSATENHLSVGDVVVVTGSANCTAGTATSITSADELEGWVDSNSFATDSTMIVMGQTVTITKMTTFDDDTGSVATIADIAADHIVEIHGYTSDKGTILATRIEVKATALSGYIGELELKGVVQHHANSSFKIGALSIDYSTITPDFTISDGLLVEVKFGTNKQPTSIEIEDGGQLGYQGDDDEEVEIYGVLASVLSNNEFMVGEQKIQISETTEFEEMDGTDTLQGTMADANMLGQLYLEVEGHFENGVLIAKAVEFEDDISDNTECTGTVSNLSLTAGEKNAGTLTVNCANPIDITVNNATIMEDDSAANISKFNLTYLNNDDTVEVYVDPTSGIVIKLERK